VFWATWQSKDDLKEKMMSIDGVPKDCKLYLWKGQLWLRWEELDDLPGLEYDPLRIKVVRPQHAGEMVFSRNCNHVNKALIMVPCKMRELHMPPALPLKQSSCVQSMTQSTLFTKCLTYSMQPLRFVCGLRVCC
jgi:hypothetical protein